MNTNLVNRGGVAGAPTCRVPDRSAIYAAQGGHAGISTIQPRGMTREAALQKVAAKEAELRAAIRTQAGLHKIAANLSSPVRQKLDYAGIGRKFAVVEPWPDGMPMIYDSYVEEFSAVKIARNGSTTALEIEVTRTEIEPFEIVARPKIPYRELYSRLYQVMRRTKERLEQSMMLREDLYVFSLMHTAATTHYTPVSVVAALSKKDLAQGFAPIEANRLIVENILMSAYGMSGIRQWQYLDLDEVARQEVRQTGYLGSIWGAKIFISDQVPQGTFYLTAGPEWLLWMPIRKDFEAVPADDPDNLLLGFTGYEFLGLAVINARGVNRGTFNSAL